MLAICSDLDETPDRHVYAESMRFLNTTSQTAMGPGIGLEVGNSIYFDMAPGQFSYWNTDEAGRAMVRTLIHSGHIDCLHSYGDLATHRRHAGRALDELTRYDCRVRVWVDHAQAVSNFGADIMRVAGHDGAAVYTTLRARAASLRTQLLTTATAQANAASEHMVVPVSLLGLCFMALLAYPAFIRIIFG